MKLCHLDLQIELDDTWWAEASMQGFVPLNRAYCVSNDAAGGRRLFEVRIIEVKPLIRDPGVGIFNDNKEASAKDRVISILKGFRTRSPIPPVEVVFEPADSNFRYKLVAGVHRFYCSLAVGFSHVPAVEGWVPENDI
ncbi:MAG: hypothetical protein M1438_08205 [Deltaproteobacteria bacterium]|nr:hypothetical protein [Deltaproteobacteria bacterium]